jgi:hypothetical protein
MLPWGYRHPRLKIAGVALAAGLLLGAVLTIAVGRPQLAAFGNPQQSTADAIASDRAEAAPAPAKAKAKAKPKPAKRTPARHKRAKHRPAKPSTLAPAAATTPHSDKVAKRKTSKSKPVAAPRRRAASPRPVRKRSATIGPRKRVTKIPTAKPAPAPPAPAAPAPAASTPAPAPAPAPTPTPTKPGAGHGHGNGHGGDDDVPRPGGG